jgi:hypothetical protein
MKTWIKPLFVIAAIYDAVLGLAFLFFAAPIFSLYGVEPPNHPAYVQFPALLLLIFAAIFIRIAKDPKGQRTLIPYGMALKASYSGLTFWHELTGGVPSMWVPWAWADLGFLLAFIIAWQNLRQSKG